MPADVTLGLEKSMNICSRLKECHQFILGPTALSPYHPADGKSYTRMLRLAGIGTIAAGVYVMSKMKKKSENIKLWRKDTCMYAQRR